MPTYVLGLNTGDDYAAVTRFGSIRSGFGAIDTVDSVEINHDDTLGYAGAAGFIGKFDLTDLPDGFVVTAAKIQLYGWGDSGYTPFFSGTWDHEARGFRLLQSWKANQDKAGDESAFSWANRWVGDWGGTNYPWDDPGARGMSDRGGSHAFEWTMVGAEDTLEEITVPPEEINYLIENPSENFGWVFEVIDTVAASDGTSSFAKWWSEEGTDGFRPRLVVTGDVGGAEDDALADDLESESELTTPDVGQIHVLLADNLESNSQLSSPGVTSRVLPDYIESNSELSEPSVGQTHILNASNLDSNSQLSTPAAAQQYSMLADDLETASELSTPTAGVVTASSADSLESESELSIPDVGQRHIIMADSLDSLTELSIPDVGQINILNASDLNCNSRLSRPRARIFGAVDDARAVFNSAVFGDVFAETVFVDNSF